MSSGWWGARCPGDTAGCPMPPRRQGAGQQQAHLGEGAALLFSRWGSPCQHMLSHW